MGYYQLQLGYLFNLGLNNFAVLYKVPKDCEIDFGEVLQEEIYI